MFIAPMFPDLFLDDVFTLETNRLFLRWPKAQDAREIARLIGDPLVAQNMADIPHPCSPDFALNHVIAARNGNAEGAALTLAITLRSQPDAVIGMIEIAPGEQGESGLLRYWLGRPFWGKGLMHEAAEALIETLFLYTRFRAIDAAILETNAASRRVLQKLGFMSKGASLCTRPAWGDERPAEIFSLTREAWLNLKPEAHIPRRRAESLHIQSRP
jgi:RimJ/RimL family protein N-acetyltransferase